jgi:hypothetical protein
MNTRQTEIVPFPNGDDSLDAAGQAAFVAIQRAPLNAEQATQQVFQMVHKTSLQLPDAEQSWKPHFNGPARKDTAPSRGCTVLKPRSISDFQTASRNI